jgi:hypothetical protein
MAKIDPSVVLDPQNTKIQLSWRHLVFVAVASASAAVAWTAIAAHVKSGGHPETKAETAQLTQAIVSLNSWRESHEATDNLQWEHSDRALARLTETVDRLVTLQAAQLAAQPPSTLSRPGVQRRRQRIENNVKSGKSALDGL